MTTAREVSIRLASHLADLLRREHGALADFLVALAEYDRRRLWLDLGHPSLFCFLHRELGLSKGAAHYRKTAAQLVQRFPEVVEPLRDGRLCITSVVELAKVLTPENRHLVLPRFFHRSRREAMAVAAEIRPRSGAPHREVVTRVPGDVPLAPQPGPAAPVQPVEPSPTHPVRATPGAGHSSTPGLESPLGSTERAGAAAPPSAAPSSAGSSSPAGGALGPGPAQSRSPDRGPLEAPSAEPPLPPGQPAVLPVPRDTAVPLTADLRRLHVTVSRRFLEKLEAARAALSHALPGANAEEVLEAGLDLLLERHAKRKGLVARPRAGPTARRGRAEGVRVSPSNGSPPKPSPARSPPTAEGPPASAAGGPTAPSAVGPVVPSPEGPAARLAEGPAAPSAEGPAVPSAEGPAVPLAGGPAAPLAGGPAAPLAGGPATEGSPPRGASAPGPAVRAAATRPAAVPAAVTRAVWVRDGGRCQWPLASGGICGSTLRVELDHVVPRARGGASTVENCRLLCRFHNGVAARGAFGDAWMDRFTRGRAGRGGSGGARAGEPRDGGP